MGAGTREDDMTSGDERTTSDGDGRHAPRPGDRVGLGRVIEDHEADGSHSGPDDVEEASDESFPASDPPAFAPGRPARRDPDAAAPDPRDVA
jgi:hypothetical protein